MAVKLSQLSKYDLPREKLIDLGSEELDSHELLALVLRNGTKDQNVLDLSKTILMNYSLNELIKLDFDELLNINGIGIAKASQISAISEITKRLNNKSKTNKNEFIIDDNRKIKKINSSKKVLKLIKAQYKTYYQSVINGTISEEALLIVYLDSNQNLIRTNYLTSHLKNQIFVSNSYLLKESILNRASYIILIHNHLKDKLDFSKKDKLTKDKIKQLLEKIEVKLLDFIIFNSFGHISLFSKNDGKV